MSAVAPLAAPSLKRAGRNWGRPRARGLAMLFAAAGAFITYLVLAVPVKVQQPSSGTILFFCPLRAPAVPHSTAVRHSGFVLVSLAIVLAVDAVVVAAVRRRRRHAAPQSPALAAPACPAPSLRGLLLIARPIGFERVPARVLLITAAASAVLVTAGVLEGASLWLVVAIAIGPWLPVACFEGIWKYKHYGAYALFVAVVLLQVGHMGEHTVQVMQLLATQGALGHSHGVFGQLDFETVHFFWDSAIWIVLCLLLFRFSLGNPWLWVAFAVASLHEVEHIYLYWLYRAHTSFYFNGGFEGIMGNNGVIGSPLARPYLHFTYNLLVVTPMVLALWDETKRVQWRVGDRVRALDPPLAPSVTVAHAEH